MREGDRGGGGAAARGCAGAEARRRIEALERGIARLRDTGLDPEQRRIVAGMEEALRGLGEAAGAPAAAADAAAAGGLVYVAEDDPATLEVTVEMLEVAGHRVVGFDHGAALLGAFARRPADLVVLDAAMPVLDGPRCAAALRASAPDLPVLILTGFGEAALDLSGIPGRPPRVLNKPVPMEHLVGAVEEALSRRR